MSANKARSRPAQQAQAPALTPGIVPPVGSPLDVLLHTHKATHSLTSKGQIASMIYAARLARESKLPFDTKNGIQTEGKGQVKGLGKTSVQKILSGYGISKVLAKEGGRTSRNSLKNIRTFLNYLNRQNKKTPIDTGAIEAWWVEQAKVFFNTKPFTLRFEAGKSLRAVIQDLLAQAKNRQDDTAGIKIVGAMLQHLIGAKLELALPSVPIEHNGFSVADESTGRSGDFEIGSATIHVTTAPGEAVVRKCVDNLHASREPIIVTIREMLPIAEFHAKQFDIESKIDVLDAEQFIVTNLHELGAFKGTQRRMSVEALVDKYNEIVGAHETDPSLKIARS